jgi:hypothetical protein
MERNITNTKIRTFQLSSDLFWGYRVCVDVGNFDCMTSLIEYIKGDIKQFLLSKNLQMLVEKLDQCRFHIHSPYDEFNDMLNRTDDRTVIYVCDHC